MCGSLCTSCLLFVRHSLHKCLKIGDIYLTRIKRKRDEFPNFKLIKRELINQSKRQFISKYILRERPADALKNHFIFVKENSIAWICKKKVPVERTRKDTFRFLAC